MGEKRKVEIFSAGCPVCQEVVELVDDMACSCCDVTVHDMKDEAVAEEARKLGIRSVPAVVVDGKVAQCCCCGPDEEGLREAGVGEALP